MRRDPIRHLLTIALLTAIATAWTLAGAPETARAQAVQAGIGFSLSEQDLTVGDPFPLTISASHPQGYTIIFPRLPAEWGSFEVLRQEPVATTVNDDGTLTTSQVITVALFAPGVHTTPPLAVKIQQPDGSVVEQPVQPIDVSVVSVLQDNDVELRDIKPPADVSVPPLWPWAGGGASAIGLLGLAAFLLWQRRTASGAAAAALDPRSAFEIAMDQIDAIEALDLPASGHFKQHYTLVADTLRGYLHREFGLPALDLTTSETAFLIRNSLVPVVEHDTVSRILRECDLVKFTEIQPDINSSWDAVHDTRAVIQRIRPQPQESEVSGDRPLDAVAS